MINETYLTELIAARIKRHSGDDIESVTLSAEGILKTNKVAYAYALDSEWIYFLATPAKLTLGVRSVSLGVALPDHPNHKGHGIYRLDHGETSTIVVHAIGLFKAVNATRSEIDEHIRLYHPTLHVFDVSNEEGSPLLTSMGYTTGALSSINKNVVSSGLLMGKIGVGLWLASTLGLSVVGHLDKNQIDTQHSLSPVINKLQTHSPAADQLQQFINVMSVTSRAGGWVEKYELRNGEDIFELTMPDFVSKDYLDALGPNIVVDRIKEDQLITVRKGSINAR